MKRVLKNLLWIFICTLILICLGVGQRIFVSQVTLSHWSEKCFAFWLSLLSLIGVSLILKPLFIFLWLRLGQAKSLPWALLSHAIRENMRAWGSILSWGLFFILPGIWRFFELYWTAWVVYLSPDYARGKLSALSKARQWFYQRWFTTIVIFVVSDLFLSGLVDSVLPISFNGSLTWASVFSLGLNSVFQSVVIGLHYLWCLKVLQRLQ